MDSSIHSTQKQHLLTETRKKNKNNEKKRHQYGCIRLTNHHFSLLAAEASDELLLPLPAIPPGALGITIDKGRADDDEFAADDVGREVGDERRRTTESCGAVDDDDGDDEDEGDVDDELALIEFDHAAAVEAAVC